MVVGLRGDFVFGHCYRVKDISEEARDFRIEVLKLLVFFFERYYAYLLDVER